MEQTALDLKVLCEQVCQVARETGAYIADQRSQFSVADIEVKGLNNFVTYVDKTAEHKIVQALSALLPEAGFITEEETATHRGEEYNWIVDPLDGTTNFIHGIPCFSVSIALSYQDQMVLGVVYEVNQQECFYAWKSGGAFLNGKPIRVSQHPQLKSALLATGFPYTSFTMFQEYMNLFMHLMQHTHGLRRMGSAAVDLAYVACGRFEGFYEHGLHAWDVAAGSFIVQEAGGVVTDFKGDTAFVFGKELLASNGIIHPEFLLQVKTFFKK